MKFIYIQLIKVLLSNTKELYTIKFLGNTDEIIIETWRLPKVTVQILLFKVELKVINYVI